MNKAFALRVNIYKHKGSDCSNGGISSKFDEILVLCDEGYIEVDLDNPPENLCVLEKRVLWSEKYYFVKPYAKPKGNGWMYGGCVVDSSDSRWNQLIEVHNPLHLHDREETQEESDILSR